MSNVTNKHSRTQGTSNSEATSGSSGTGDRGGKVISINEGWKDSLMYEGDSDRPVNCLKNVIIAFEKCPAWEDVIGFNILSGRVMLLASPPWTVSTGHDSFTFPRTWNDTDTTRAIEWLHTNRIMTGKDVTREAVKAVSMARPFDPLVDYLDSLKWDGNERINTWLTVYLGVEPSEIVEQFGARFLISAVSRAYTPGSKVDTTLILEGEQGKNKSSALRILARKWFLDELPDIRNTKEAAIQLLGKWIIEASELDNFENANVGRLKAWLVRQEDNFRPPWGTFAEDVKRRCVFVGTTNKHQYLKDETGGRRFWPVVTGEHNLKALADDVDQLWAEAVYRYRLGDFESEVGLSRWWFDYRYEPDLVDAATVEQAKRYIGDPWDYRVSVFLKSRVRYRSETYPSTTIEEIFVCCLKLEAADWTTADDRRVARSLRVLGWERYRVSFDKDPDRPWRYRPKNIPKVIQK